MLLYITAEDALGDAAPARREPRPLHSIPATVSAHYDMGMRHHIRPAVMLWPAGNELAAVPDWKFDRMVIRLALYCREKLGLGPGGHAAVFGRPGWLWPVAEFATLGLGAAVVGIEHDALDAAVVAALGEANPKVIFATDRESLARLKDLRAAGLVPRSTIVSEDSGADAADVMPLATLLELAGTLDTAERAQDFRSLSRRVEPGAWALWHVNADGVDRLTHAGAMQHIGRRLRARPPQPGDLAFVQPLRITLAGRLALAASVGDGLTVTALAGDATLREDVARLRPHTMRVSGDWLENACKGCGPRWPGRLDRRAVRRRVHERVGDRVRLVETDRAVDGETTAALAATGAEIHVD